MLLLAMGLTSMAADDSDRGFSYVPQVHGAFRTRWEMDTKTAENRFQVRNARLSVEGKVARSIDYFIQSDFNDAGQFKLLDAYGRMGIVDGLAVKAGQFRMPFGVEPHRSPANYIFANRSFMGKQMMNYRAVGVQVGYTVPTVPFTIEAGVFNPGPKENHNVWNKTVAYSAKASYRWNKVTFTTGFASIKPYSLRANLVDATVAWNDGKHWNITGEYIHKAYCNNEKPTEGWLVFVDWHMPVKLGVFNRWSVQVREDGMTRHIKMDGSGIEPARDRVTIGSTLTFNYKAVHADVRINYEEYFYHDGVDNHGLGNEDRILAELVIRF